MRTPKDWGQPCPNPECVHYNRMQQGNVSAIATYLTQSGNRRIFRCHTCELPFSETRETVFFRFHRIPTKMPFRAVFMRGWCRHACMDDLVVKFQPLDIVDVILWPVLRPHVVYQLTGCEFC